tara:strand:+ start:263 stop:1000 length:738 start_codon:yes stop_codon:yes gene_type:complete
MSSTQKLKTVGINKDGTASAISVTKKKKRKSNWIIPAAIGTAALFAGWGGLGSSTGGSIMDSIKGFFGFGKKAADTVSTISSASKLPGMLGSRMVAAGPTVTSAMGGAPSFLSSLGSDGGNLISNVFKSIGGMSGEKMMGWGSLLSTVGSFASNLFDKSDEIAAEQFQDVMDYRYKALEQEKEIADAVLHQKQRELGVDSTFMGHTSPIATVEGLNVEEGYQPKKPATFADIHPTGGLITQGQTQ